MSFFHQFAGGAGRAAPKDVDNNKFYELLGVNKEASEAEIKKAFRKQAMTHHPDKGGDPEKFKEISKAYEILSDKEKKAIYDQYGEEGLQDGGAGAGGAGMDIFDLFGMGGGRRNPNQKRRGEDVVFPLKVTLEDLYNGCTKKLRLTKNVICSVCNGKGGKDGAEATCSDCKGQGIKMVMRQLGPGMIQQMQVQCAKCKGSGSSIAEKDKCTNCHGEKTTKEKKQLEVYISKGMKNNERITFSGEADEAPGTVPGDVVVVLQQTEHAHFKREGLNLFYKQSITLLEALTGFHFVITHLDGRQLSVTSPIGAIVKPGDMKKINNEGFPHPKNPYDKGNLYIEFDVVFPTPKELNNEQRQQLLKILPAPNKSNGTNGTAMTDTEEVVLHDVNIEEEKLKFAQQQRAETEEDDEDGHGHGRQSAQCRTQ